jgi:hypothetical protein
LQTPVRILDFGAKGAVLDSCIFESDIPLNVMSFNAPTIF